jgi:hypothetical protein
VEDENDELNSSMRSTGIEEDTFDMRIIEHFISPKKEASSLSIESNIY